MDSPKKIIASTFLLIAFAMILTLASCAQRSKVQWVSPYDEIDWNYIIQAKSLFHCHTSHSDGFYSPHVVVDHYHKLGFDVLALTDHWIVTYPWQEFSNLEVSERTFRRLDEGDLDDVPHEKTFVYEDRNPDELGMLAIMGSEPSPTGKGIHHLASLFSDVTGVGMDYEDMLKAIGDDGGLLSFAHPGRRTERNNNELEDYIYYFEKYPHIYGIDIFNTSTFGEPDRYPYTKELYAGLLKHFGSPGDEGWRPVWLTSTDDFHRYGQENQAFQIQLLNAFDQDNVYNSLVDGAFFWIAKEQYTDEPVIKSIDFDRTSITVNGTGYDEVSWYFNNEIIHTGETFDFFEHGSEDVFYVYFLAHTSDFSIEERRGALLGSQPIWITTSP